MKKDILDKIRDILISAEVDARDVITMAEELKTDALITICMNAKAV